MSEAVGDEGVWAMRVTVSRVPAAGAQPGQGSVPAVLPELCQGRRVSALSGCCTATCRARIRDCLFPLEQQLSPLSFISGAPCYQFTCMCPKNKTVDLLDQP